MPAISNGSQNINHFQLNSLINLYSETYPSHYHVYPVTEFTTFLTIGKSYFMQIGEDINSGPGGASAVWIDYNNDFTFSQTELIFSSNSTCYSSTYITIPNDTSFLGLKRMRVMHASYYGSLSSCGSYDSGETEDYYITITDSIVIPEYCIPIDYYLNSTGFIIDDFKFNTLHNCNSGSNEQNYNVYLDSNLTTNLEIGKTYDIYISCGTFMGPSGGFKVWIDYNNNNIFSSGEKIFQAYDNIASGFVTIPNNSSLIGRHRIRVRSQWTALPVDPCTWTNDGETEDYFINIIPAIIDTIPITSSEWELTYNIPENQFSTDIKETYDKGFVINSNMGENLDKIFLMKISVDGTTLWTKLFNLNHYYQSYGMDTTYDGGFILCGYTSATDTNGGAGFALKLDACGEQQWEKYFGLPDNYDVLSEIYQLADSNFIALGWYLGPIVSDTEGRINLIKLNSNGDIIWQFDYSHYYYSIPTTFIKTKNKGFLISGYAYTPILGDTSGYVWERSLIIKVDSLGNEEWHAVLGDENNTISISKSTTELTNSGYLTLCNILDTNLHCNRISIFKTDIDGGINWVKPLAPDSFYHFSGKYIKRLNDTLSVIIAHRYDECDEFNYRISVFVIDTLANVLYSKTFGNIYMEVGNINVTSDNKIIIAGTKVITNNEDIYTLKLNYELGIDTFYNYSINYDSVCDIINSNKITDRFNKINVVFNPNPSSNFTFLTLENYNNQFYTIEIFNINGILVKNYLRCNTNDLKIDCANLKPGVYIAKIKFEDNIIISKTIILFPDF